MGLRFLLSGVFLLCLFTASVVKATNLQPSKDQFNLTSYQDNYVLPYYYTSQPNQTYFAPQNPNGGSIAKTNVQFQFSLKYGLLTNIFTRNDGLYFSYTQKSNWQAYDKSAYFRDTQYQPELFWAFIHKKQFLGWTLTQTIIGLEHQSNGKGGVDERSWNRAYADINFTKNNFNLNLKPWIRIRFPGSKNYNPDILHYLGYGNINFSWQQGQHKLTLTLRNLIESNFSLGYEALSWRFPIYQKLNGYLKLESGYGTTISNYNYYDNAVGIGISL